MRESSGLHNTPLSVSSAWSAELGTLWSFHIQCAYTLGANLLPSVSDTHLLRVCLTEWGD